MRHAVVLAVGAVLAAAAQALGDFDDLDDLSHMIDELNHGVLQAHNHGKQAGNFSLRNAHSTECDCDPQDPALRSSTLVCQQETHHCRYTALNRGHDSWDIAGQWWGHADPNGTCSGTTQHSSIRVSHPFSEMLEQVSPLHNASHWTVPAHRCKMLRAPNGSYTHDCACCDCAAVHYCWSPKVLGSLAFQGPGPGDSSRATRAAGVRKDRCIRLSGLDESRCRSECAQIEDCEGIAMHGGECVLAREGCMNRGCAVDIPLGSNPYRNGCYHSAS